MTLTRPTAVAGTFYPSDTDELRAQVDELVAAGAPTGASARPPKALIVPHAGYVYSGPIAGSGYAALLGARGTVERVVLLGPNHYAPVRGIATVSTDHLDTPLGPLPVDDEGRRALLALPYVDIVVDDAAHAPEHSLEVHLPFIARVLGEVRVLPLLVGRASPEAVAAALDAVWGGPETLIVVSTDLSHYLDQDTATTRDRRTAEAIVSGAVDAIHTDDACGAAGVRGLLVAAQQHGLNIELLDLRCSGDTGGPSNRVVGYGAFALAEDRA